MGVTVGRQTGVVNATTGPGAGAGRPRPTGAAEAPQASGVVPEGALPGLPRAAAEEVGMVSEPLDKLEETYRRAVGNNELPGLAYAILRDGKVVRANALGVRDLETKEPWRCDTLCRLYSMTKSVAVVGFMSLVQDGLVALSDPVSKYLPAFARGGMQVAHDEEVVQRVEQNQAPSNEVTILHLLTHSSGLSYGPALGDESGCKAEESYRALMERVDKGEVKDLEQYCNELAQLPLRFEPGKQWEYSYSIDVIGRIMEVVSGKRLDECLRERVLEPLKLHDTGFAVTAAKSRRLASFYRRRGEEQSNANLEAVDNAKSSRWTEEHPPCCVLSAGGTVGTVAGGLVSSLNDFTRLCLMLQNEGELDGVRVLWPETVRHMCRNLLPEVTGTQDAWCLETAGLGFGILGSVAVQHPDANWYDTAGEVGWGGLAGTAWAVDHREKLVVVTFCQVMYELWIDEEARKAARRSLGYEEPPCEEAAPVPEAAAQSAEGGAADKENVPPALQPGGANQAPSAEVPQAAPAPPDSPSARHDTNALEAASQGSPAPEAAITPPTSGRTAAAKRASPEAALLEEEADEVQSGKKQKNGHDRNSAQAIIDCGKPSPMRERNALYPGMQVC